MRIYHNYNLWEDVKHGFYNLPCKKKENKYIDGVIKMFESEYLTEKYMKIVIDSWHFSCEQNLTNENMNRIAYLGQAACCIYVGSPNLTTMKAWRMISPPIKDRANRIALKIITKWEQKRKLENTLTNGKEEGMMGGYQMKLQLSWKKED